MKRFITYVYVYENGVKGKNAGFIKAEQRDGIVKMEMQFRGLGRFQGKSNLDLIVPEQAEECGIRIPFGTVEFHHGMANTLLEDKETKIASSKYDFSQVVGVRMDLDDTHYLASCWVEHAEQYVCNLRTKGEDRYKSTMGHPEAYESPARVIPGDQCVCKSTMKTAPVNQRASESPTRATSGRQMTSGAPAKSIPVSQRASESPVSPTPGSRCTYESPARFTPESQSTCDSAPTPQNLRCGMPEKTGSSTIVEKVERKIREDSQEMCEPSIDLRKIDIADIRKLPKQNWYLCNNSFLIHGFFNYHHLMVKRVTEASQTKCYLGVPGVYEKPERMMALLFGFPEFEAAAPEQTPADNSMSRKDGKCQEEKLMNQNEINSDNFGYWYCLLDM